MATSGTYTYTATAATIIQAAFEDLGVVTAGTAASSTLQAAALVRLNYLAKQFQGNADMAQGLKVHTRQRIFLFLAKGQRQYLVGPASGDARATTQYGRTTIRAAEAAGQTVLDITATTDTTTFPGTTVTMTASDFIGVVQNDGTIFWDTIASTGAGPTVTMNNPTTVAAAAGNYVYWFTSRAQRFPLLEFSTLRNSDGIDMDLDVYTEVAEYAALPDKNGTGDPICILCEPLRLNTRIITDYLPQDVTKQIVLTVLYPAENYDATSNDIAFPQEWFAALEWELAFRLVPLAKVTWTQQMQMNYDKAMMMARQLNPANSSAYFQPNEDWR